MKNLPVDPKDVRTYADTFRAVLGEGTVGTAGNLGTGEGESRP